MRGTQIMIPVIFSIGPLHLYAFGLMVALGILLSLLGMERSARREGFPAEGQVWDMVFVTIASGFLGARIHYVLQDFEAYARQPLRIFAVWEGGLIFYGGAVMALIVLLCFMRIRRIPIFKGFDFLIPFGALTHAFGRIGCFLNGCCYGKNCDLPWAVHFPGHSEAVHPTQLYEALFDFFLFFFLRFRYGRKHFEGEILSLYFMLYPAGRFVIEFFRDGNPSAAGLTWNQWWSLLFAAIAAAVYFWRSQRTPAQSHGK